MAASISSLYLESDVDVFEEDTGKTDGLDPPPPENVGDGDGITGLEATLFTPISEAKPSRMSLPLEARIRRAIGRAKCSRNRGHVEAD